MMNTKSKTNKMKKLLALTLVGLNQINASEKKDDVLERFDADDHHILTEVKKFCENTAKLAYITCFDKDGKFTRPKEDVEFKGSDITDLEKKIGDMKTDMGKIKTNDKDADAQKKKEEYLANQKEELSALEVKLKSLNGTCASRTSMLEYVSPWRSFTAKNRSMKVKKSGELKEAEFVITKDGVENKLQIFIGVATVVVVVGGVSYVFLKSSFDQKQTTEVADTQNENPSSN